MASYSFSAVAEDDLVEIFKYGVRQWGLTQADSYYEDLMQHIAKVATNPLRFQAVTEIQAGLRRSRFKSHSIYFTIDDSGISVQAILRSQNTTRLK